MSPSDEPLGALLDPSQIEVYLLAHGWQPRSRTAAFSTWVAPAGVGDQAPLFLPLSRAPHDFETRLREFVWDLAEIEREDRDVLITNLRYATADLVRVRLTSPRVGRGELPIADGAELFDGAKDLMLAAACAAIDTRPSFGPRMPQQALDYVHDVRLGQTERGSYVVTVISRVTPPEQQAILPDEAAHIDVPFERRVTNRLVTALTAARDAAVGVLDDGNYGVFDDAVESGVSANLCNAIASMGTDAPAATVEVSVDWASSRPATVEDLPSVAFEASSLPVLREAVTHLRQLGPFDDELIEGFVSRLTRGNDDEIGTIVIEGEARGAARNVHVELPDDQYASAVGAHRDRLPVRIRGTLYKRGRSWVLSDPGQLTLGDPDAV